MSEIILNTNNPDMIAEIVRDALKTEALRLSYSLKIAKTRLKKFEKKYNISSEKFINEWTAEDLEGKDLEYVEWAGEHKLYLMLNERVKAIKGIKHVSP
ncbi:MAG: hypothetical protein JW786_15150 [Desulfobacterales bacterium]|nr:hypothetical protein [Desulfobacterales bacterium]